MGRYDNQSCDGCGAQFEKDDDIVVCPYCGTPQHRSCWEKKRECVNESRHEEGFQWKPAGAAEDKTSDAQNEEETITCPRCGEHMKNDTLFCPRCGQPSIRPQDANPFGQSVPFTGANIFQGMPFFNPYGGVSPDEKIENVPVPEVAEFVQSNTQYYIPRFKKMGERKKGKLFGWNWGAFFFGYLWFFFRKNVLYGIIAALLETTLSIFTAGFVSENTNIMMQFIENPGSAQLASEVNAILPTVMLINFSFILLHSIFAVFADGIYRNKIFTTIKEAKEERQDVDEFRETARTKGGISFLYSLLAYTGVYIITSLIPIIVKAIGA